MKKKLYKCFNGTPVDRGRLLATCDTSVITATSLCDLENSA